RWITPDILRVISARLPTAYHTQPPALPPSIDEPLRFTDGSLDRAWRMHFHSHADSDVRLHEARQGDRRMPAAVVARARLSGTFDMDGKGIQMMRTRQLEAVMRRESRSAQDHLLDLRGKDVDAANDEHVVRT